MHNLTELEEVRRKRKPYKLLTTLAAAITIVECLEVWGCGWTLITLLSGKTYIHLWEPLPEGATAENNAVMAFQSMDWHQGYDLCVITFLVFYTAYLMASFLLIWGNTQNKVIAFMIYNMASVVVLLLSASVTIFFLATGSVKVLAYFSDFGEANLAYLLLLLYFSRYFFLGWILRVALFLFTRLRRKEIEEEKDVDIQTAVDKAFKSVFEQEQDVDSVNDHVEPDDHRNVQGEREQLSMRLGALADGIKRIPRAKVDNGLRQRAERNGDVGSKPAQQMAMGFVNKSFEQDTEDRLSRYEPSEASHTQTRPHQHAEDGRFRGNPGQQYEQKHRRVPCEDLRSRKDGPAHRRHGSEPHGHPEGRDAFQDRGRHYSGYDTAAANGQVPQHRAPVSEPGGDIYDRRLEYWDPEGKTGNERDRGNQPYTGHHPPGVPYQPATRHQDYMEYEPGREPQKDYDHSPTRQTSDPGRAVPGRYLPADYSTRDRSPPTQYDERHSNYPTGTSRGGSPVRYPQPDVNQRHPEGYQDAKRVPQRVPQGQYDPSDEQRPRRAREDHSPPPAVPQGGRRDFETRSLPGEPRGLSRDRDSSYEARERRASRYVPYQGDGPRGDHERHSNEEYDVGSGPRGQEAFRRERSPQSLDAGRFLRDDDVRLRRPASSHSPRDSGHFAYGPGPLGYQVSSPSSRPRSLIADEPRSGSTLKREESIVKRLSHHYDANIGPGLRSGPAPVGGVPAIGPASIRRD